MVFKAFKQRVSGTDDKYEVLYHKYSAVKAQNIRLKNENLEDIKRVKEESELNIVKDLIELYKDFEMTRNSSFKVKALDKDTQKMMVDFNKTIKHFEEIFKKYKVEQISAEERYYDSQIHDIASYQPSNGMKQGIIIKTVKKGFRYKGNILQKPLVVITK